MTIDISISFDKLDHEYLNDLCERTGKSQQDVIKLALTLLHNNLCNKAPSLGPFVSVQPQPYPYTVIQPFKITTELEHFPNSPDTIWMNMKPNVTCGGGIDLNTVCFTIGQDPNDNNNK